MNGAKVRENINIVWKSCVRLPENAQGGMRLPEMDLACGDGERVGWVVGVLLRHPLGDRQGFPVLGLV